MMVPLGVAKGPSMIRAASALFCLLPLLALPQPGAAADLPAANPQHVTPDPLKPAREQIAGRQWAAAITELQRVNAPQDADWQNLMGYAHRKLSPPDLAAAERHYGEALRIQPRHRGALEYSGELALMKGDLATAEARLAALDQACTFSCEEYRDLKMAVERYKAQGRYVAEP
jgi:hypothetical protein